MAQIDLSNKFERLEVFEERAGVTIQGLSAFIQDQGEGDVVLRVCGEIQTRDGTQLRQDVELIIAVYDSCGRIIGTSSCNYYAETFFALETINDVIFLPIKEVSKIRVYPKKGE